MACRSPSRAEVGWAARIAASDPAFGNGAVRERRLMDDPAAIAAGAALAPQRFVAPQRATADREAGLMRARDELPDLVRPRAEFDAAQARQPKAR